MQEALGADFTDFNRTAQPSSFDLDPDHRLHSFPGSSFTPLSQADARGPNALSRIGRGRRLRAPGSRSISVTSSKWSWCEFDFNGVPDGSLDRPSPKRAMSTRYLAHPARCRCRRVAEGLRAACGGQNMMIDCSCVCHWQFQNEVIGG